MPTPPEPATPPPDTAPAERVDLFVDPGAVLTVLEALETLAIEQVTLTIPSTVIDPGQPAQPLVMLDFRAALLRDSTPLETKDRAWRHLCQLAREQRGDWNLYALGTAFPRLRKDANRLRGGRNWHHWQQVHFNLAVAFLFGVHDHPKLEQPSVFRRLADNAYDQASGRKTRPPDYPLDVLAPLLKPREHPHTPYGNPERDTEAHLANRRSVIQLLEETITTVNTASGRQRITPVQATLIRRTYLDSATLREVAAELKLSEPSASKQRTRAENVIARHLGRPDLARPLTADTGQPAPPAPRSDSDMSPAPAAGRSSHRATDRP